MKAMFRTAFGMEDVERMLDIKKTKPRDESEICLVILRNRRAISGKSTQFGEEPRQAWNQKWPIRLVVARKNDLPLPDDRNRALFAAAAANSSGKTLRAGQQHLLLDRTESQWVRETSEVLMNNL